MNRLSIEYSIVSRGTEKYSNRGYMAVSSNIGSYRYIMNIDHNIINSDLKNKFLKAKSCYKIQNIAFSRFQLITALMFTRNKYQIDDGVLILGLGSIGFSCLLYLLDNGFKKITIYIKKINDKIEKLIEIVEKNYNVNIKIVYSLMFKNNYNTYIDTTGNSMVLKKVFECANFNSAIIILSTPREDEFLISPLTISRNNLIVIGGHELNGIENTKRQELFEKLLAANENKTFLETFVNIYNYSEQKLNSIKKQKSNFIEMFKY